MQGHFNQVQLVSVHLQEVGCAALPCSRPFVIDPQNRRPIRVHLFVQSSSASRDEASVDHPHPLSVI
jgi:hypothetical protein